MNPNQEPDWITVARALIGVHEGVGPAINPQIIDWAKQEGGWVERFYTDDEIPWCGLFVGHCLQVGGHSGPKNPLAALGWSEWGQPVPPDGLSVGTVVVFKRSGGGHVGFYVGEEPDGSALHVLGGNQSDQVSITRIPRMRLFASRWPEGVSQDGSGPLRQVLQVGFSQKES
jgi:uncharacterized protein (TIGR02594 family)